MEALKPYNWDERQMNKQQTLRLVQEFCAVFKPRDGTARADDLEWLIRGPSPATVGWLSLWFGLTTIPQAEPRTLPRSLGRPPRTAPPALALEAAPSQLALALEALEQLVFFR